MVETKKSAREAPLVRIFISSPGDVAEERILARQFIDSELPKLPPFREKVKFELIAWDDPAAQIPMLATETPQDSVNAARPRPATCDIVIVILWSRMGTPLPDSLRKPNREPYLSGTEWEYEDAVNSPQQPRPQVLVYRRTEKPKVELGDPELADRLAQFQRVEAFFAQFRNADGSLKGGINEYATPSEFKTRLSQHLQEVVWRRLQPSGDNGGPLPAAATIPLEYIEWLQRTCADASLLGQDIQQGVAITLNHVYVPAITKAAPAEAKMGQPPTAPWNLGELKSETKSSYQNPFEAPRSPGSPPWLEQAVEAYLAAIPKNKRLEQAAETYLDYPQQISLDYGQPIPLLKRLDKESLYVPAAAGAGKSTFCRWAVLQAIAGAEMAHPVPAPERFTESLPANLRGRLPLFVPLREFWRSMDCGRGERTWYRTDLEKAVAAWVDRSPPPGLTGALLKSHLKAGSALLLLDGLDEVPVSEPRDGTSIYPRELLLSGLAAALPDWQKAGNRTLLTSRPYGLDEARLRRLHLPSAPLEPLPPTLQDLFVTRWFYTLGKQELTPGLIETIRSRGDLAPLVENPMLLTGLCVLYDTGGRLPEDRYELYKRIVNNVLYNRFPGDIREREPVKARLEVIALGMHTGEKDSPRLSPAAEVSFIETERLLRDFALEDRSYEHSRVEPAARREELLTRSGLLLPRPNERVTFYHLSFQEFLAAERILRASDDLEPIFRERMAVAEWRLTLMFLLSGKIASKTPRWGSDLLERLIADQTRATVAANPAPAVFITEALELYLAKGYRIPDALAEAFRRLSVQAIEAEIEPQVRLAIAQCMGRLVDPSIRDLRASEAYVEVSAGTYPYGETGKTVEIVAPFRLGRYPVTNRQYKAFLDDGGYRSRKWWSDAGWEWLRENEVTEPRYWRERRWNASNQPVVGVSFWEAEACCIWAGGRLPREEEWEAATRGLEGYEYPWGNDWQDRICNTEECDLGITSPVGLFPRSRQIRLGIEDLAGNVFEWCGSYYHDSVQARDSDAARVLRGGSWYYGQGLARSAYRNWLDPSIRDSDVGFRVVCSSPSPDTDH